MRAAIPASVAAACVALGISFGLHLGGLALGPAPESVELEGSEGARMTMEGTAFADLVQGVSEPVAADPADVALPTETEDALKESAPAPRAQPDVVPQVLPDPTRAVQSTKRRVTTPVPKRPETSITPDFGPTDHVPHAPVPAAGAPVIVPVAPARPVEITHAATVPVTPPLNPRPQTTAPVETSSAVVEAVEEDSTTPRLSATPRARPAEIEARAAEIAAAAARAAERRATERRPAPQGNNRKRTATRGSAGGGGQATSSGAGRTRASGNAAAANYPGQVQRRIASRRMPRNTGRGLARVAFTIAGNGGLASLGLAASSGNATLDRAALNFIRRTAPFPPPPPGARRQFVIPVEGR